MAMPSQMSPSRILAPTLCSSGPRPHPPMLAPSSPACASPATHVPVLNTWQRHTWGVPCKAKTLPDCSSPSSRLSSRQHTHGSRCHVTEASILTPTTSGEDARLSFGEEAEVLIELKNVHKAFGSKKILKGASFKIREGEAVGIIGPSGTGKSTVLKLMAGLLAPDEGEVWVSGKQRMGLLDDGDPCGLRIGLVFQSAALFDSLTVRENVGFLLYEHSSLGDTEIEQRVRDSLLAVGLKGVEDRMPSELSGGMRKRVALARAIISESSSPQDEREVVMYDEPTAGLDPIASTVVEDLIRSLHIQMTQSGLQLGKIASYVVVTHQHSTIRRAVDRLLFLYDGQVQWEGSVEEFDTTDNPLVRQFAEGSLKGPIKYL